MLRSRWRSTAAASVASMGWLVGACWIVGMALHDRTVVTQWLSWIPAPSVAVAMALCSLVVGALQGWKGVRAAHFFATFAIAAAVWTVHTSLGLGTAPAGRDRSVRILQWNTDWPSGDDPLSATALAGHPADIALISNHGEIMRAAEVARWAPIGARAYLAGPFALVTAWPVLEARQVAASGPFRQACCVASFVVLPPGWDGRPLRIAMVDLPSRPMLPRRDVARVLREGCERGGLGRMDLVAGDFNAIDGSVILRECFPGFRDALDDAGRGWLCTWPRTLPLWKIDHVLLGEGMRAVDGEVRDPGTSHHRMTIVDVEPR